MEKGGIIPMIYAKVILCFRYPEDGAMHRNVGGIKCFVSALLSTSQKIYPVVFVESNEDMRIIFENQLRQLER